MAVWKSVRRAPLAALSSASSSCVAAAASPDRLRVMPAYSLFVSSFT